VPVHQLTVGSALALDRDGSKKPYSKVATPVFLSQNIHPHQFFMAIMGFQIHPTDNYVLSTMATFWNNTNTEITILNVGLQAGVHYTNSRKSPVSSFVHKSAAKNPELATMQMVAQWSRLTVPRDILL
jgi:hypothetical protein